METHVTKKDLEQLRDDLLTGIKAIIHPNLPIRKWIKSYEVKSLLNISSNTLARYRKKYKLTCKQVGQTNYYNRQEILGLLASHPSP